MSENAKTVLSPQTTPFAGSGWTPSRSTLVNLVEQVDFVAGPLVAHMTRRVQQDVGVGIDDTSFRMLLPKAPPEIVPGDAKSRRLAEKVAETRAKGESSLLAKMWAYSGLHLTPYNIFDFRVSRHREGPDDFFHARRKVVEAMTYRKESELLLGMIQALYDIETRAKDLSWQDRGALRQRESTVVLAAMGRWLESQPMQAVLPLSILGVIVLVLGFVLRRSSSK